MMRSLYTAATGMMVQEQKMNVVANNLANSSTTGFKRARAEFSELMPDRIQSAGSGANSVGNRSPTPIEIGLGARVNAVARDFGTGDLIGTDNPLDLAIEGPGFLRVSRQNGDLGYTRAGNMRIDSEGRLVTAAGDPLDPGITMPPEATEITIAKDGSVSARVAGRDEPVSIGAIELTSFQNPAGLESIGGNLYRATSAAGTPTSARPGERGTGELAQGFLEGSNVKSVEEMLDLITTQRAYEMNSKIIQTADQMLQKLSNLK
jgi:flagellar basal-body rod protein FlgG